MLSEALNGINYNVIIEAFEQQQNLPKALGKVSDGRQDNTHEKDASSVCANTTLVVLGRLSASSRSS